MTTKPETVFKQVGELTVIHSNPLLQFKNWLMDEEDSMPTNATNYLRVLKLYSLEIGEKDFKEATREDVLRFLDKRRKSIDVERTIDSPFWITTDQSIDVPMMNLQTTFLNSTRTEDLQIIQLPYQGNKLSMLIILPHEKDGLSSIEENLSAETLDIWQKSLYMNKVSVFIPKFELETDYELNPILKNLGMVEAFDKIMADFSGMSNSQLFVSEAVHKAFINVNEKGTEAAATGFMMTAESAPQPIRADHPFLFVIQDDTTENILFIGRVINPLG